MKAYALLAVMLMFICLAPAQDFNDIDSQNSDQGAFTPTRAQYEFGSANTPTLTGEVVINEINYNSSDDFNPEDWVELYNPDETELDVSGWEFRDEDDEHHFYLPDDTVIPAHGYLVLVANDTLFTACFPDVDNYVGNFDFGLSGSGELIRMFNAAGVLVDSVLYDDEDPWPLEPDGNGPTLALIDPDYDNYLGTSWEASEEHGTPGASNSGTQEDYVAVINEINYSSAETSDSGDWVEIYNPYDTELDVSAWMFRDEDDDHLFTIPDNTVIPANGYLVLVKDDALFTAIFPTVTNYVGNFDFGLSGDGELVRLYNVNSTLVDTVCYGVADPWPTEPCGGGQTLSLIDPDYDNALAASWRASTNGGTPGAANDDVAVDDNETHSKSIQSVSIYPNPFNPQTTICLSLPADTRRTTVCIYNVLGQRVLTLADEPMSAGDHSWVWHGTDDNNRTVGSGVYFVRASSTGGQTNVKRMLLLK